VRRILLSGYEVVTLKTLLEKGDYIPRIERQKGWLPAAWWKPPMGIVW
jgi:hypothetical protein